MKLLHNAYIHTQDPSQATASAIVIDRERIVTVGEANTLLPGYPNAEKQDMNGRVILPGLTDAHLHLKHYSLSLQKIDCETDTKEECLRRVEEQVKKAKPGEWVLGIDVSVIQEFHICFQVSIPSRRFLPKRSGLFDTNLRDVYFYQVNFSNRESNSSFE